MSDPVQIVVRAEADSATAKLRSIHDLADKDNARRISAELKRIAAMLDRKYNFPSGREIGVAP